MSEDLSPEAREMVARLAAAKEAQRDDKARVLDVLARAAIVLAELREVTDPQTLRLPGRSISRTLVREYAKALIINVRDLTRELNPK
jgi:hypothetical protein